jgi:hypothetical protein
MTEAEGFISNNKLSRYRGACQNQSNFLQEIYEKFMDERETRLVLLSSH